MAKKPAPFHIVKREEVSWKRKNLIRLLAILSAILLSSLLTLLITDIHPISFFKTLVQGAIGTNRRLWMTLQALALLQCISVALAPAFKMRFWNTGAEGQVLMGSMASVICMVVLRDKVKSQALLLMIMLLSSLFAGMLWALIPAFFKAKWNTNETLFTLMMNYVAMQIVSFFVIEWSVPKGSGQIGVINQDTKLGWLPKLFGNPYILNVIFVVLISIFVYFYMKKFKHGYELAVVGESINTAKYIGIDVGKVMIRTLMLSGTICGFAGFLLVAGFDHTITPISVAGRGFTAIMVCWLGNFNPLYMVPYAGVLVFMDRGASEISTIYSLNISYGEIITAIIIFFIIAFEFFIHYKIQKKKELNSHV